MWVKMDLLPEDSLTILAATPVQFVRPAGVDQLLFCEPVEPGQAWLDGSAELANNWLTRAGTRRQSVKVPRAQNPQYWRASVISGNRPKRPQLT
jgi:hypothetical protein